jgi:hypothetical protein
MPSTITHDDKFQRRFRISASGDVIDQGSKLENGIGNLLTVENHLRITTTDLGAANQIEVRARNINDSTWTNLKTITGNTTEIVDITTYNVIHFYVANYDSSEGYLNVTGFVKNNPPGLSDSVTICDQNANCADLIDIGGNYALPVVPTNPVSAPNVYNITIGPGDENVEQSQVLLNGTRKILIKHRDSGSVDFSFTSGLATYIEIPKGNSYAESDLNLQGRTLYFRTPKQGVIEILTWS